MIDHAVRVDGGKHTLVSAFREMSSQRELIGFLFWRDIRVRYRQTWLGIGWALIQPLFMTGIFAIVFGLFIGVNTAGVPYPVFVMSGILPWSFFSQALSQSATSILSNSNLVTKVYFQRMIIPLAAVLSAFTDFMIGMLLLAVALIYYRILPGAQILVLPAFILLAIVSSLGVGLLFAGISAKYRDVRYVLPFLMQAWLFATPVIYPTTVVKPEWRFLYAMNPMAGVVEGFRWSIFGTPMNVATFGASTAVALVLFWLGVRTFLAVERSFADVM